MTMIRLPHLQANILMMTGDYVDDIGIHSWNKNDSQQKINAHYEEIGFKLNLSERENMI